MFDGKYFDWNQKKVKAILDFYGYPFINNKNILDLGCGYADVSGPLYRLGANVIAVDARPEHLKVVSTRYPGIKVINYDLNNNWISYKGTFDIILNLSLLCHLSNYEMNLRMSCANTKYLILETAVCDSDNDQTNVILTENTHNYDSSINGFGSRPGVSTIERILKECGMSFQRLDLKKFNSGPYKYDWVSNNDNSYDFNKRRIWFCEKNIENKIVIKNDQITKLSNQNFRINSAPLENSNIIINHSVLDTYKEPTNEDPNTQDPNIEEPKKLKIALCISGHMRTFEETFPSIQKYILSDLDCDVFIHTWDTLGLSYRPLDNNLNKKYQNLQDNLNKLFRPKKIIIEPRKEFMISNIMRTKLEPGRDIHGMLSMFYKIEACNDLKKEYEADNNIKYDIVIRFRSDLLMGSPLPINKNFKENFLYIPMYGNFGGLCDQFAFGSSEVMDKYSSIFSNIENHLNNGAVFNPEKLLNFHVNAMKLLVHKEHVKYVIKRSNGLIQDNMLLERALGFIR